MNNYLSTLPTDLQILIGLVVFCIFIIALSLFCISFYVSSLNRNFKYFVDLFRSKKSDTGESPDGEVSPE